MTKSEVSWCFSLMVYRYILQPFYNSYIRLVEEGEYDFQFHAIVFNMKLIIAFTIATVLCLGPAECMKKRRSLGKSRH